MAYFYIDEKGPQETIRISGNFTHEQKLNLGNDKMSSYVANVIGVKNIHKETVEAEYLQIVSEFNRQNSASELKGAQILKSNFEYGIASMREKEVRFYNSLIKLLEKKGCYNLIFAISKYSIAVNVRFSDFILELQRDRHISGAHEIKYLVTKFFDVESSQEINKMLFDNEVSNKEFINMLIKELQEFVNNNKGNMRMVLQIDSYKKLIKIFKQNKYKVKEIKFEEVKFDWQFVKWALDLHISELKVNDEWENEQHQLILDEGIPDLEFHELGFSSFLEGQESHTHVGLQITDMLVVLTGKQISKMKVETRYDRQNPEKAKRLSDEWFIMNEKNFNLICLLKKYLYQGTYSLVYDTYFDDLLIYTAYLEYVSSYSEFASFNQVTAHSERFMEKYMQESVERWRKFYENEVNCNQVYGSVKGAIDAGMLRSI